mmetsp:Transcript_142352/g.248237  ORF Transcript_142352/g.248237 Transcript_142352/m.248237 type:complete len:450 (+) Transcript_142352:241-1590(+)
MVLDDLGRPSDVRHQLRHHLCSLPVLRSIWTLVAPGHGDPQDVAQLGPTIPILQGAEQLADGPVEVLGTQRQRVPDDADGVLRLLRVQQLVRVEEPQEHGNHLHHRVRLRVPRQIGAALRQDIDDAGPDLFVLAHAPRDGRVRCREEELHVGTQHRLPNRLGQPGAALLGQLPPLLGLRRQPLLRLLQTKLLDGRVPDHRLRGAGRQVHENLDDGVRHRHVQLGVNQHGQQGGQQVGVDVVELLQGRLLGPAREEGEDWGDPGRLVLQVLQGGGDEVGQHLQERGWVDVGGVPAEGRGQPLVDQLAGLLTGLHQRPAEPCLRVQLACQRDVEAERQEHVGQVHLQAGDELVLHVPQQLQEHPRLLQGTLNLARLQVADHVEEIVDVPCVRGSGCLLRVLPLPAGHHLGLPLGDAVLDARGRHQRADYEVPQHMQLILADAGEVLKHGTC